MNAIMAEVGRYYMVPCLYVPLGFYGSPKWVPVLGPKHEDFEHLGFPHPHFHVDWRFVDARVLASCESRITAKPHGKVITNDGDSTFGNPSLTGSPEMKRRKCKRTMPDFPARPSSTPWVRLERAHKDCVLRDNHICPHRGIDLRPFAKPDGTAICPGHGLRWDLNTGRMLPHHSGANA